MSNQLNGKEIVEEARAAGKAARRENSKLLAGWNGAKFYAKALGELIMGASAIATILTSMLNIKGYDYDYNQYTTIALGIAWVLTSCVVMIVLGKFLVKAGKVK